ncbi:hypothetical protein RRF57_007460 [Xylaria bambusicola]|uniref:Integral membrane protein n=1 Tax=Xylaria bambusicola TaxID=326684 RepID=A0AAN7ZAF5_9PEZI
MSGSQSFTFLLSLKLASQLTTMSRPPPKDYEHPPTAAAVITTEWILLGTAALLISARLFLRLKINRQGLTISDGFICSAWSAAVAYNSFDILYMKIGALKIAGPLGDFHTDPVTMQKLLLVSTATRRQTSPQWDRRQSGDLILLSPNLPRVLKGEAKRHLDSSLLRGRGIRVDYGPRSLPLLPSVAELVSTQAYPSTFGRPTHTRRRLYFSPRTLDDNDACPLWAGAMLYQIAWALHFSSGHLRLTGFITLTLSLDHRIADSPFTLIELWCAIDCNIGVIVATLPSLRPYLRMIRQGSSARPRKQLEGHALADYYLKRRLARIGRPKAKDTTLKSETNVTTTVAREDWEPEHDIPSRAASRGGAAATEMGSEVDLVEQRG